MLLNAVRAAKGYPLQFSKVTSYTGQGTVDGGLSIDLPFVLNTFGSPGASRILGTARPSSTLKSGVSQLQLADLNTAEIQRKLRTQVTARDFAYYRSQGWQKALVNTILIEELHLEPKLVDRLDQASEAACERGGSARSGYERHKLVCQWRAKALRDCRDEIDPERRPERRASPEGDVVVVYANNPRRFCQYVAFQWFFAAIRVLDGASLDVDADLKVNLDECTQTWTPESDKEKKEARRNKVKSKAAKGGKEEEKEISESVKDGKVSVDIGVKSKVGEKKDDEEFDKNAPEQNILINIPRNLGPARVDSLVHLYGRSRRTA